MYVGCCVHISVVVLTVIANVCGVLCAHVGW